MTMSKHVDIAEDLLAEARSTLRLAVRGSDFDIVTQNVKLRIELAQAHTALAQAEAVEKASGAFVRWYHG